MNEYNYRSKPPNYYLAKITPDILVSFSPEQLEAITFILNQAIPKPAPKIVDFKFVIDLIFSRFYIVLFVGKDIRRKQRQYINEGIARVGNLIAAATILIVSNLVLSAFILLVAYLLKSAIGINLFPGHLKETITEWL